jgi:hypothetical protein
MLAEKQAKSQRKTLNLKALISYLKSPATLNSSSFTNLLIRQLPLQNYTATCIVAIKMIRFPFPKMQDYIKVPFELDISKNVEFDTVENAVATIKNAVKNAEWLPDTQYMALFVNPVPKLEKDETRKNIYYKIKEILTV